MRLSQLRASAALAFVAALATILGMVSVSDLPSGRDHDGFVRPVRSAFQRLKTTDAGAHEYEYEPPEPVATSGLGVSTAPDAHVATHDRVSVHAPPGVAMMPTPGPDASPVIDVVLLAYADAPAPVLSQPHRPALGRAPPLS